MACFVLLLYLCTLPNLTTGTDLWINVFFCTILILQQENRRPYEMGLWNIYVYICVCVYASTQ